MWVIGFGILLAISLALVFGGGADRRTRLIRAGAALLVGTGAIGAYAIIGKPGLPEEPFADRAAELAARVGRELESKTSKSSALHMRSPQQAEGRGAERGRGLVGWAGSGVESGAGSGAGTGHYSLWGAGGALGSTAADTSSFISSSPAVAQAERNTTAAATAIAARLLDGGGDPASALSLVPSTGFGGSSTGGTGSGTSTGRRAGTQAAIVTRGAAGALTSLHVTGSHLTSGTDLAAAEQARERRAGAGARGQ